MDDVHYDIAPDEVIREIASAIPSQCRDHLIIVGSLAAGWHYAAGRQGMQVRTKDADCLLAPQSVAVAQAAEVAATLMAHGWLPEYDGRTPGGVELPVIRLRPPHNHRWFIELMTWTEGAKTFLPVTTPMGEWSIAAFPYLSLTGHRPVEGHGIRIARPEMMALANLLNHPGLSEVMMSRPIGQRRLRRCCKDLGRVLALVHLEVQKQGAIDHWIGSWSEALNTLYPSQAGELAARSGRGIQALLASETHLDQAHHSCVHGLLAQAAGSVSPRILALAGQRLLSQVVQPLRDHLGAR